ncbi:MAG: hypothetical protein EXR60_04865 [Dehalococcoidia bacterium]|nr:hypothetical protein [Dehalococcoidia bacterium]
MGSQIQVVLNLAAGPAGVDQPAHIHDGQCPGVAGIKYSLTSVKDGKSTTTVNATLDSLMSSSFAINVHKSGAEVSVYTSCGNISSIPGGSPTSSPSDGYN